MQSKILSLLQDPQTHSGLELIADGLKNETTGRIYPIRDGIPVFLDTISGLNLKYQAMYDKLALGYDFAESAYLFITRKPNYRLEFIPELEIASGARVLEVSVGTGGNMKFLPEKIDFFGLDLSWGMLKKCAAKLKKNGRATNLFQGEAERLPFRDATFDCVFHVGGINFFNDKSLAIREMIRVARPGTKIVIVDETEEAVRELYQRNPLTRRYYEQGTENVACPIDLIPEEMTEIKAREIVNGKVYCLTFRKP
ncbi:MAG: methyltransferase domain-containing protein [Terracidiphilus sp.]|jgi:ubiquinone/menaquinone biosynthesis C-methylase UbiE/uncharacterized protein YbaR (Trm112 family)